MSTRELIDAGELADAGELMDTGEGSPSAVDPARFRHVLSHFASGVVVVTGITGGSPAGLTCQSFTALSLEPPMVLFCPSKASTSWPQLTTAPFLCINILSHGQRWLSDTFARSGADKFAGVTWTPTPHGAPALDGAAAHIEACVAGRHDGGDHHIVICHVESLAAAADADPLLYYRSGYHALHQSPR
jgi:3-hydroxy-9,10-secoandrosta-1,3,5(10)-triene-9,17-dione monooxygenase reductase component